MMLMRAFEHSLLVHCVLKTDHILKKILVAILRESFQRLRFATFEKVGYLLANLK